MAAAARPCSGRARGKPVCARPRLARAQRHDPWSPALPSPADPLRPHHPPRPQPRTPQHLLPSSPQTHPWTLRLQLLQTHLPPPTTTTTSPRAINHLKCILVNARSVHKHAVELWDLLDSTAPDVAFITETWMNASSAPDIATAIPEGYKISRKDRTNQVGGGIAIVFKDSISATTSTEDTPLAAEHLHFQIRTTRGLPSEDPSSTVLPDRAPLSATPSPTSSPRTPSSHRTTSS
ncbi:hypothetical protein NDU88_002252 [Pleurodeles waltl]|uniref:Endonuclease/exonuclease/phosphatase domain-containing protein n=1 Tax=Pleurodeles waltl TaxID=8319 RepID=A0AAV7R9K5_PLEWA|nr:hypothetical protein NDU88_002252 [Pleurodeles waltl]